MKVNQGSIIYAIRDPRYEKLKSFGIVITPKCDIFNGKVSRLHMLVGYEISDWIRYIKFPEIFEEYRKKEMRQVLQWAKSKSIDIDKLMAFSYVEIKRNIVEFENDETRKNRLIELIDKLNLWADKYDLSCIDDIDCLLDNELRSHKKDSLNKLFKRDFATKYCFLPKCSYIADCDVKTSGLVVDLRDIREFTKREYELLNRGAIDLLDDDLQLSEREVDDYKSKYYLESDEDYVSVMDGHLISSPWLEYLIQHFTNSIGRIGVDNATRRELDEFVKNHTMSGVLEG